MNWKFYFPFFYNSANKIVKALLKPPYLPLKLNKKCYNRATIGEPDIYLFLTIADLRSL